MIVMIMEKVPACLRGTLSLWFLEPKEGVFVGNAPEQIRDEIWQKTIDLCSSSAAVMQIWFDLATERFHYRQNGIRNSGNIEVDRSASAV